MADTSERGERRWRVQNSGLQGEGGRRGKGGDCCSAGRAEKEEVVGEEVWGLPGGGGWFGWVGMCVFQFFSGGGGGWSSTTSPQTVQITPPVCAVGLICRRFIAHEAQ